MLTNMNNLSPIIQQPDTSVSGVYRPRLLNFHTQAQKTHKALRSMPGLEPSVEDEPINSRFHERVADKLAQRAWKYLQKRYVHTAVEPVQSQAADASERGGF